MLHVVIFCSGFLVTHHNQLTEAQRWFTAYSNAGRTASFEFCLCYLCLYSGQTENTADVLRPRSVWPLTCQSEVTKCVPDPTSPCVTQGPCWPSWQHLCVVNKPQLIQSLKTETAPYSDAVSHFTDKLRRITWFLTSLNDRQNGKQREAAETQSNCLNAMNVSSAQLCVYVLHTPSAPSTRVLQTRCRHQRELRLVLSLC